jgi:rhodanese-related sulfurtransferase
VYQFQNTIQVKKIQNCVSHAYGLVFDVSSPQLVGGGLWQKKTMKQCFGWHLFKLMHYQKIAWALVAVLCFNTAQAQRKVKSGSYNAMLKTLLKHSVPEMSVDSLAACQSQVVLLDAREPNEYAVSHLANALPVGYNGFTMDAVKQIDKNAPVVVYCSVGYRSEKVAEKLIAAGFTNVRNLYGGIFEWKNQQQPVVDTEGQATNKVHAYSKMWGIWLKHAQKVYN